MSIAVLTLGIAAALMGFGLTLGCCVDALKRWRKARAERRQRVWVWRVIK